MSEHNLLGTVIGLGIGVAIADRILDKKNRKLTGELIDIEDEKK
jgi:hypothetical protein